jgi:hypothetical protein
MNELLKKLLDADILSEESKSELESAFQLQLEKVEAETREEVKLQVETELKAQWITTRDALIEAIDAKMNDYLIAEMDELRDDISKFRDLEVEYAAKLTEAKQEMSVQLRDDIAQLVENLDVFLNMRVEAEFAELRNDIQEAKKLEFGRKVFEAFLPEYRKYFVDANATERELQEAKTRIDTLSKKFKNVSKEKASLTRKIKMESTLSPLTGKNRDVMESILKSVPTEELSESYAKYIGRVLKESKGTPASSETVVSENVKPASIKPVVIKTGNNLSESTAPVGAGQATGSTLVSEFQRLAGITA